MDNAVELIKKSSAIGIALSEKPTLDDAVSFFALWKTLEKQGKKIRILFSGEFPKVLFDILPAQALAMPENKLCDFIISVDQSRAPIKELRYERTDRAVNIILTPRERPITKESIAFAQEKEEKQCDLMITVGAQELDDLGKICETAPELFCENPVIALAAASTEYEPFSEITITDAGKSSLAESTVELIAKLGQEKIDIDAATALLLGIAEKTNNFAAARASPATLACAESLIKKHGAQKDAAARALQTIKSLPLLQLWGRAAVRSKIDEAGKLLISMLTADDFTKTNAAPEHGIRFVLDHMEEHFSIPKKFVLFWQHPAQKTIHALMKNPLGNAVKKGFVPSRFKTGYLEFQAPFASFQEAEDKICAIVTANE